MITRNDWRELWLERLEKAIDRQGRSVLCERREGQAPAFCCLGVALDLMGVPWESGLLHAEGSSTPRRVCRYAGETRMMPLKGWLALGLLGPAGDFKGQEKVELREFFGDGHPLSKARIVSLAGANDAGVSFARIAAWIRKNPEKVFHP